MMIVHDSARILLMRHLLHYSEKCPLSPYGLILLLANK